jgi:hypothetical protein
MAVKQAEMITVTAPDFRTVEFMIRGTSPYVQLRFSEKARLAIEATQKAGSAGKAKKNREAKDFDDLYTQAMHKTTEGKYGIPATAFRNAMISACRTIGVTMTRAKLAVFVEADAYDKDGTPLVFLKGEPKAHHSHVRNDSGVIDIRVRPMWEKWTAKVRVRFDASMISATDVANLLMRVGMQVGIGEGRPDSKDSAGMGWGLFGIVNELEEKRAA